MNEEEFQELLRQQRMLAQNIVQESSTDSKIKLLDIINDMITPRNKKIQIENIILEAMNQGFTEQEALTLLDELKKDHVLYETSPGFIQRTKDIRF